MAAELERLQKRLSALEKAYDDVIEGNYTSVNVGEDTVTRPSLMMLERSIERVKSQIATETLRLRGRHPTFGDDAFVYFG